MEWNEVQPGAEEPSFKKPTLEVNEIEDECRSWRFGKRAYWDVLVLRTGTGFIWGLCDVVKTVHVEGDMLALELQSNASECWICGHLWTLRDQMLD